MNNEDKRRWLVGIIITIISAIISAPFLSEILKEETNIKETMKFMDREIEQANFQYAEGFSINSIKHCNNALNEYNNLSAKGKNRLIDKYLDAQYILGIAYYNISMYDDRLDNLEKTIRALNCCLNSDSSVYEYALINISKAYLDLSRIIDMNNNLNQANNSINSFIRIHEKKSNESYDYAKALMIRGTISLYLSEVKSKQNKLYNSINDYKYALQIMEKLNQSNPKRYIKEIGIMRSNLGSAYRLLSEVEDTEKNLDNSKYNNSIALKILNNYSYELADAKNNRGTLCLSYYNYNIMCKPRSSADNEDQRRYLEEAIMYFNESLHDQNKYRLGHIDTIANLEYAKVLLSQVSYYNKCKIDVAIKDLTAQMKNYNKTTNPIEYAKANSYMGSILFYKARNSKNEIDFRKSIDYYNESLGIWSESEYPLYFAETSKNIGLAYAESAKMSRDILSFEKAMSEFRAASEIWRYDPCPRDYAYSEYLLGIAYKNIYQINKDYTIMIESLDAFKKALILFNESDYPEMYQIIKEHINDTITLNSF